MRNDRTYRKKREALKRQVLRDGLDCSICHGTLGPIKIPAQVNDPLAFEADHELPVSHAVAQGMSYARAQQQGILRPAHRVCNQRRGNRTDPVPGGLDSDIEVEW